MCSHPSIFETTYPVQGRWGWRLSQHALGQRQSAPCTGHLSNTGLKAYLSQIIRNCQHQMPVMDYNLVCWKQVAYMTALPLAS